MEKLIYLLILIMSIYGIGKLLLIRKKILVYTKTSRLIIILVLVFIGVFYFLAYNYGKGAFPYFLVTVISIYFYMNITTEGLGENEIIYLGNSRGINNTVLVNYEDFRLIEYREKDDIELSIQSKYGYNNMKFDLENREKILKLLGGKKALRIKF